MFALDRPIKNPCFVNVSTSLKNHNLMIDKEKIISDNLHYLCQYKLHKDYLIKILKINNEFRLKSFM